MKLEITYESEHMKKGATLQAPSESKLGEMLVFLLKNRTDQNTPCLIEVVKED